MRKYAFLLCASLSLWSTGCSSLAPKAYDPVTSGEIDQTVKFETTDYDLSLRALTDLSAPDLVKTELTARHDSELARLKAWKAAEEAKKLPGVSQ